jgi:hypothetical protein
MALEGGLIYGCVLGLGRESYFPSSVTLKHFFSPYSFLSFSYSIKVQLPLFAAQCLYCYLLLRIPALLCTQRQNILNADFNRVLNQSTASETVNAVESFAD